MFRKCEFVRNKGRIKDNPAVGGGGCSSRWEMSAVVGSEKTEER